MQFSAKFNKLLWSGFRATLMFRKFKVALNNNTITNDWAVFWYHDFSINRYRVVIMTYIKVYVLESTGTAHTYNLSPVNEEVSHWLEFNSRAFRSLSSYSLSAFWHRQGFQHFFIWKTALHPERSVDHHRHFHESCNCWDDRRSRLQDGEEGTNTKRWRYDKAGTISLIPETFSAKVLLTPIYLHYLQKISDVLIFWRSAERYLVLSPRVNVRIYIFKDLRTETVTVLTFIMIL